MKVYIRRFDRQTGDFTEKTIENYGGYKEAWEALGLKEPEQVQLTKNVILHQDENDSTGDTTMSPFFDIEGILHFLTGNFMLVKFENNKVVDFDLNEADFLELDSKFIGLEL